MMLLGLFLMVHEHERQLSAAVSHDIADRRRIDTGLRGAGEPVLSPRLAILLGFVGASVLAWLLTWGRTYVMAWVSERIAADLRNRTYGAHAIACRWSSSAASGPAT